MREREKRQINITPLVPSRATHPPSKLVNSSTSRSQRENDVRCIVSEKKNENKKGNNEKRISRVGKEANTIEIKNGKKKKRKRDKTRDSGPMSALQDSYVDNSGPVILYRISVLFLEFSFGPMTTDKNAFQMFNNHDGKRMPFTSAPCRRHLDFSDQHKTKHEKKGKSTERPVLMSILTRA